MVFTNIVKRTIDSIVSKLWVGMGILGICISFPVCANAQTAPYPASPVITGIQFNFSTHSEAANGADNWPITWADDDNQYTSWGDGFGFAQTSNKRSLGVSKVSGGINAPTFLDIWDNEQENGGAGPSNGKSYGIISVNGALYMWVGPGSGATTYDESRLWKSTNHGTSWTSANWAFVKSEGLITPTFAQFGRDYQGARDSFVYSYASLLKGGATLQTPGEIALLRVPKTDIMNRTAYEFFAGLDGSGNPVWTANLASRQPVFKDPNGVGFSVSVSYNPGIGRYFLITEHSQFGKGKIGIFDSPEPWGPWTTVTYTNVFGASSIPATTFFWNFSNKWLSQDGLNFVLIFTGTGGNDSWNTVEGNFDVSQSQDTIPPGEPQNLQAVPTN